MLGEQKKPKKEPAKNVSDEKSKQTVSTKKEKPIKPVEKVSNSKPSPEVKSKIE